jgi:hypothetical protein
MKTNTATGYPAGSFVLSADQRTVYQVRDDGSWKRLPISGKLFLEQREKALGAKQALTPST